MDWLLIAIIIGFVLVIGELSKISSRLNDIESELDDVRNTVDDRLGDNDINDDIEY